MWRYVSGFHCKFISMNAWINFLSLGVFWRNEFPFCQTTQTVFIQLSHLGTNRHSDADRSSVPPYKMPFFVNRFGDVTPPCAFIIPILHPTIAHALPTRIPLFLHTSSTAATCLLDANTTPSTLSTMQNNTPRHSDIHSNSRFSHPYKTENWSSWIFYEVSWISNGDGKMFFTSQLSFQDILTLLHLRIQ